MTEKHKAQVALNVLFSDDPDHIEGLKLTKHVLNLTWPALAKILSLRPQTIEKMVNRSLKSNRLVPHYVLEEARAHLLNALGRLPEWTVSFDKKGQAEFFHHTIFPRAIFKIERGKKDAVRCILFGWSSRLEHLDMNVVELETTLTAQATTELSKFTSGT